MTFYYRVDNFQDRVMVSITCMLVIANVQSSINTMVPKTSYLKMIDYFLMYSFNIIIVVMVYHTYQATHVLEPFAPNEDVSVILWKFKYQLRLTLMMTGPGDGESKEARSWQWQRQE